MLEVSVGDNVAVEHWDGVKVPVQENGQGNENQTASYQMGQHPQLRLVNGMLTNKTSRASEPQRKRTAGESTVARITGVEKQAFNVPHRTVI